MDSAIEHLDLARPILEREDPEALSRFETIAAHVEILRGHPQAAIAHCEAVLETDDSVVNKEDVILAVRNAAYGFCQMNDPEFAAVLVGCAIQRMDGWEGQIQPINEGRWSDLQHTLRAELSDDGFELNVMLGQEMDNSRVIQAVSMRKNRY